MTSLTEKVIRDQFPYLRDAIAQDLPDLPDRMRVFVGCGTSYYLAQTLACASNAAGHQAVAVPGAEWARRPQAYVANPQDCVVIGLSRSGTTTETIQAINAARDQGLPTWALSCEAGSPILTAAQTPIYLPTDPREGIVMTVSASLMLLAGLRLCGLAITPADLDAAAQTMAAVEKGAGAILKGCRHLVFLGAGPLYGIACEGALKVQEMSLSFAQAFHPMEYRHGPISLIDDRSVVTLLYDTDTAREEATVAADVRAKGARVIGIGGPGDLSVPRPDSGAAALIILPALQLLGEMVAKQKNINTETPRHLTKVVMLSEG
jgi:glucosamine--fructose-6-phosphate aminotransferase (isomerizing)